MYYDRAMQFGVVVFRNVDGGKQDPDGGRRWRSADIRAHTRPGTDARRPGAVRVGVGGQLAGRVTAARSACSGAHARNLLPVRPAWRAIRRRRRSARTRGVGRAVWLAGQPLGPTRVIHLARFAA